MYKIFLSLLLINIAFVCNEYQDNYNCTDFFQYNYDFRIQQINESNIKIDNFFENLRYTNSFNGNILIAKGTDIIYKASMGYEDYGTNTQLNEESIFQIGSVSKQFTAYAIMMLHERGSLEYSDSIQQYIPEFPYKGITIQQLLTHRSGLANYMYFCDELTDRETPVTNEDVISLMCEHKPTPYYKPNQKYSYSNTGYLLLASIVERISGKQFEDFMKEEIFHPLGMKNTFVYNMTQFDEIENKCLTTGYHSRWKKVKPTYLDGTTGDKNVYTTIEDMYKWSLALKTEKLLSETSLRDALKPYCGINYGYGWRIRTLNGNKIAYHGGWWRGYKALFVKTMKSDYTILVMSNLNTKLTGHIFNELLPIL